MRKYLINNFALYHRYKFLWLIKGSSLRAPRIIFPLFVISGLVTYLNPVWPDIIWWCWLAYVPTLISLYFGFIYFEFYPIKNKDWDLLDEEQKYDFGWYIQSSLNTDNPPLEDYQLEEWNRISQFIK